ncbi:ankyrin repeat protein (Partial), partial [Seminavis robusta]|eukprot:Sro1926_g305840.1 ankyrin repeat protein (50) ;mRNA; r:2-152
MRFEAAANGHLEILKYAHENGGPWDERTCTKAAQEGHFKILQYALKHGAH